MEDFINDDRIMEELISELSHFDWSQIVEPVFVDNVNVAAS